MPSQVAAAHFQAQEISTSGWGLRSLQAHLRQLRGSAACLPTPHQSIGPSVAQGMPSTTTSTHSRPQCSPPWPSRVRWGLLEHRSSLHGPKVMPHRTGAAWSADPPNRQRRRCTPLTSASRTADERPTNTASVPVSVGSEKRDCAVPDPSARRPTAVAGPPLHQAHQDRYKMSPGSGS
ncbi:hypothetical protein NDU88_001889 [Pleurodeles waltl]|uniref:Uncharacterized protein n=1 Tax=Pleurodeles waltl TaxID=8319 RepID=A0AAV7UAR0_PLEWA|nr:hypothetical protein NDU88_001889 [Pleurodeles waltl]